MEILTTLLALLSVGEICCSSYLFWNDGAPNAPSNMDFYSPGESKSCSLGVVCDNKHGYNIFITSCNTNNRTVGNRGEMWLNGLDPFNDFSKVVGYSLNVNVTGIGITNSVIKIFPNKFKIRIKVFFKKNSSPSCREKAHSIVFNVTVENFDSLNEKVCGQFYDILQVEISPRN